ncbi:entry exclusion lipoprotein TrbK [Pseudomonas cremoricolorata]|uniref:entry exclusion lipoprotein TrbK n=1 Tax=Pseudomonas cremoricolorata TaxID=157783 RepID=UPI00041159B4|nr:entry exclusion lipoprotein TrbK [Pseudomonas cremoricolorata]
MLSKWTSLSAALGIAVLLAGCSEEKVPQATEVTCAPDQYEQHLASLSKDANKQQFKDACQALLADKNKNLSDWTFKKSPKDDF